MAGRQPGFCDCEERLRELSAQGDPLERLGATVDFEMRLQESGMDLHIVVCDNDDVALTSDV